MAKVNIKIEGQAYQVEEGLTILEAARECGYEIPSLCAFNHGECSLASCRVCLVEATGARGLVASCVYPVQEGMEVKISSPKAVEARRISVELLLSNHSFKCQQCEKNGHCELLYVAQITGAREDKFMALRIFEYGIRGAMQHGQQTEDDDTINLDFPEPVVIYLRKGKNVHNEHKVNLNLPGYDEPVVYKAKVRYVSDYTIQDMIDQKCYPLIPFFPMRFEDEISKIHDASFEESMNRNICDLVNRLRNQVKVNELMIKDYIYITNAMGKIYGGLVSKSKSENTLIDEKGVKQTMDTTLITQILIFTIGLEPNGIRLMVLLWVVVARRLIIKKLH